MKKKDSKRLKFASEVLKVSDKDKTTLRRRRCKCNIQLAPRSRSPSSKSLTACQLETCSTISKKNQFEQSLTILILRWDQ